MGQVSVVVGTERSVEEGVPVTYVQNDRGGGEVVDSQLYGPSGDDSPPLPGDFLAKDEAGESGADHVLGVHDPKNAGVALPGEKRSYARSPDGVLVAEIWMHGDGAIDINVLTGKDVHVKTTGQVWLDSPNVKICDSAGRRVACVGDMVIGSVRALTTAPGSPIAPQPPATPTASGGVPFSGKIVGPGSAGAKA